MTVRTAELVMAALMLAASIGIMVKSAELNISWIPGRGPGAGAWPFWLAAGMALACIATMVRWLFRVTPESRSREPFVSRDTLFIVLVTIGALVFLLLATWGIGMYFALMLFLLFYVKFVGRHSWYMGLAFMIGVPVFVFCLFEWALTTSLPKGAAMFDPLYYPLYDMIYTPGGWRLGAAIIAWIALAILLGALEARAGRKGALCLLLGLALSPVAGLVYHIAMRRRAARGPVRA